MILQEKEGSKDTHRKKTIASESLGSGSRSFLSEPVRKDISKVTNVTNPRAREPKNPSCLPVHPKIPEKSDSPVYLPYGSIKIEYLHWGAIDSGHKLNRCTGKVPDYLAVEY